MLKDLLKIAVAFALQSLIRGHYYATEVRKSELSRATLSFFPKTKCPIFAYPNDSTAKSTIEPPFRMLSFIKNLYIFSILIICIILDLVYGSATSFIQFHIEKWLFGFLSYRSLPHERHWTGYSSTGGVYYSPKKFLVLWNLSVCTIPTHLIVSHSYHMITHDQKQRRKKYPSFSLLCFP